MSVAESADQCRAITADGDRCSRPAQEDGFCHQHDNSDRTVDDRSDTNEMTGASGDANDNSVRESTDTDNADGESSKGANSNDGSAAEDVVEGNDEVGGILEVRERVQSVAERLIGEELDGVIEITRNDDDWLATVEVIERPAIPNTQDIMGKYEVALDRSGNVTSYRRLDTYRRGDTSRGDIAP